MKVKVKIDFWLSGITSLDNAQIQNGNDAFKKHVSELISSLKDSCNHLETTDNLIPPLDSGRNFNKALFNWSNILHAKVGESIKPHLDGLDASFRSEVDKLGVAGSNRPLNFSGASPRDSRFVVRPLGLCVVQNDGTHKCTGIVESSDQQPSAPFTWFTDGDTMTNTFNINTTYTFINE